MLHIFRRKKFQRRVLLGILILIIPAFVFWGVGGDSDKPKPIGKINKKIVSQDDFISSIKGTRTKLLLSYYTNYDVYSSIARNRSLMNKLAWERIIFLYAAKKDNIKVSNNEVMDYLTQHPLFQRQGIFDTALYERIVTRTLSLDQRQFEEFIRENLLITSFQDKICGEIKIPEKEIRTFYTALNGKFDISYIYLDSNKISLEEDLGEEELKDFYKKNKDIFNKPAMIELEYMALPYSDLKERSDGLDKMAEIYEQSKEYPTKFEDIAAQHGLKYKLTNPIKYEGLIPGIKYSKYIYKIVFSMEKNEITPPIISGKISGEIYIFHKTNIFEERLLSYDEAKDLIEEKLLEMKRIEFTSGSAKKIYNMIVKDGGSFEDIAKVSGKEINAALGITIQSYLENIGPAKEIIEKAVNSKPGDILFPLNTGKGFIITKIEKIITPGEDLFEKQKELINNQLIQSKRNEIINNWLGDNEGNSELFTALEKL